MFLAVDLLSGDDNLQDDKYKVFNTLYGTNHKFYGEMDFFLNIPVDTEERGLRDIGGALGAKPLDGLHFRAAYHLLQAMAERPDGLETFGHELDIKGEYRFWTYARTAVLYGVFFPQGLQKLGVADPQAEHFAYVTADVKF